MKNFDDVLGGSFKVKKAPGSTLPEDRQRYWNAYMLLYESRGGRKRPVRSLTMSATSSSPVGASRKISMPTAPPRESLSQLSDLLEKGEKTGLFSSRDPSKMPSTIEQGIQVELVSKELNHLAAILHVYAGGLNFMK